MLKIGIGIEVVSDSLRNISKKLVCGSLYAVKRFFTANLGKRDAVNSYLIRYLHPEVRFRELLSEINARLLRVVHSYRSRSLCDIEDLVSLAFMNIDEQGFELRLLGSEDSVNIFIPELQRKIFGSEIDISGVRLGNFLEKICENAKSYEIFFPFLNLLVSGLFVYHSKELPTKRIPLEEERILKGTSMITEALKQYRKKIKKSKDQEAIDVYDLVVSYVEARLDDLKRRKTRAYPKEGVIYIDLNRLFLRDDDKNVEMLYRFLDPQFIYVTLAIPIFGSHLILPTLIMAIWHSDSVLFSAIPTFDRTETRNLKRLFTISLEYMSRFIYETYWAMERYSTQLFDFPENKNLFRFIRDMIIKGAPGYRLESESRLESIKSLLKKLTGGDDF